MKCRIYHRAARRKFNAARQQALKSDCSYRLGAVVMKQKIVGRGFNTLKSHPMMQDADYLKGIHAEISACIDGPRELAGTHLYVCRLLRNGEFALAKPCDTCQRLLDKAGVRKVYYTISNEEFGILDIREAA